MFYSSLTGMGLSSKKGQAEFDVNEARADASEAKSEAELLKHDIDRLFMISEALWTFLKKEHGYSDGTSWSRRLARLICGMRDPKVCRSGVPLAAGWFRNIGGFAFIVAIRFRKALLSLEPGNLRLVSKEFAAGMMPRCPAQTNSGQ